MIREIHFVTRGCPACTSTGKNLSTPCSQANTAPAPLSPAPSRKLNSIFGVPYLTIPAPNCTSLLPLIVFLVSPLPCASPVPPPTPLCASSVNFSLCSVSRLVCNRTKARPLPPMTLPTFAIQLALHKWLALSVIIAAPAPLNALFAPYGNARVRVVSPGVLPLFFAPPYGPYCRIYGPAGIESMAAPPILCSSGVLPILVYLS